MSELEASRVADWRKERFFFKARVYCRPADRFSFVYWFLGFVLHTLHFFWQST